MFKDYYMVLEIDYTSNDIQIKNAYKAQAKKWHPDRNSSTDATLKMQEINEAFLILNDLEAKRLYDVEYNKYKRFILFNQRTNQGNSKQKESTSSQHYSGSYVIEDDVLKKWMQNARNQAKEIVRQAASDVKGVAKATVKGIFYGIIYLVIFIILMNIIFLVVF